MTLVRAMAVGLTLAVAVTAGAEDKKAKFDPAKIVGEWTLSAGEKDGEKLPAEHLKGVITFTKDTIAIKGDDMSFGFKYTLDPTTDPASIDMEITEPEALKGTKAKGILGWDGEKLKLTYNAAGKDRPKEFATKKESGDFGFTLAKKVK